MAAVLGQLRTKCWPSQRDQNLLLKSITSPHPFLPENPSPGTQQVLGDAAKLPELVTHWEEDANHSEKRRLKKSPFLHKWQSKSPGRTSVSPPVLEALELQGRWERCSGQENLSPLPRCRIPSDQWKHSSYLESALCQRAQEMRSNRRWV